MDNFVLICSFFILIIVSVNAGPTDDGPHANSLEHLCKDLKESIAEGNFISRKKVLDDCTAKSFSDAQGKALANCRTKLPLETPTDVEKVCSDLKTFEPKFREVQSCFKTNTPEPSAKKKFKACLMKALEKN